MPITEVSPNGTVMTLGTLPRLPGDVLRERPYALRATLPPRAVDLSQPRLLSRWQGRDVRSSVAYQGAIGSCAAFSGVACAEMAARIAGRPDVVALHPGWVYREARKIRGWQDQDAGAYMGDVQDVLMVGAPRLSLFPYKEDARFVYPPELDADRTWDYVLSHRPFYPSEGQVLENIWMSLDAGMPVQLATAWPRAWFTPDARGVLPEQVSPAGAEFGHAVAAWGIVPGYVLCQNSWAASWTPEAAAFGFDLRPGDFAIPWSYFQAAQTPLWEFRAVSFEPVVIPEPEPEPIPEPEPAPPVDATRLIIKRFDREGDGWRFHSEAAVAIAPATGATFGAVRQVHGEDRDLLGTWFSFEEAR